MPALELKNRFHVKRPPFGSGRISRGLTLMFGYCLSLRCSNYFWHYCWNSGWNYCWPAEWLSHQRFWPSSRVDCGHPCTTRSIRRQLCRLFMCIVFAGILQILFGVFKLGFFANFIPNNVILGLLAAIGAILIVTQLPYLFGLTDFSWKEV